jgi:hypothetical protein
VGWLVLAVVLAVLSTTWVSFTATRLDRLHARVDAAQAALDAQLVRRAAAVLHVAQRTEIGLSAAEHRFYEDVAQTALIGAPGERQRAENAVSRAVTDLVTARVPLPEDSDRELREAAERVLIARRFYNDAVRDTRTLRARRMPRLLRLAGRRGVPEFFDIDDSLPPQAGADGTRAVAPAPAPTTAETAKES